MPAFHLISQNKTSQILPRYFVCQSALLLVELGGSFVILIYRQAPNHLAAASSLRNTHWSLNNASYKYLVSLSCQMQYILIYQSYVICNAYPSAHQPMFPNIRSLETAWWWSYRLLSSAGQQCDNVRAGWPRWWPGTTVSQCPSSPVWAGASPPSTHRTAPAGSLAVESGHPSAEHISHSSCHNISQPFQIENWRKWTEKQGAYLSE